MSQLPGGRSGYQRNSKQNRTDNFNKSWDIGSRHEGKGGQDQIDFMETDSCGGTTEVNGQPVTTSEGNFLLGFTDMPLRRGDRLSLDNLSTSSFEGFKNTPTMHFGPYADLTQKIEILKSSLDKLKVRVDDTAKLKKELIDLRKLITEIDIVDNFANLSKQVSQVLFNQNKMMKQMKFVNNSWDIGDGPRVDTNRQNETSNRLSPTYSAGSDKNLFLNDNVFSLRNLPRDTTEQSQLTQNFLRDDRSGHSDMFYGKAEKLNGEQENFVTEARKRVV